MPRNRHSQDSWPSISKLHQKEKLATTHATSDGAKILTPMMLHTLLYALRVDITLILLKTVESRAPPRATGMGAYDYLSSKPGCFLINRLKIAQSMPRRYNDMTDIGQLACRRP